MKLELWEILVPKADNDGNEFSIDYHRKWDSMVREMAGGLTIMRSAKGIWDSGNKVYEERMIPVRIACTEDEIRDILNLTKNYYNQIKVMAYSISEKVIIFPEDA
jgi:hypothetical protein